MNYKKLIENSFLLKQELNEKPHTYDTILKDDCNNITQITKLQKKLNKLFKEGKVGKTYVRSVKRGKVIYYGFAKKYNLIVTHNRFGTKLYYCQDYTRINQYKTLLIDCKELIKVNWVSVGDVKITNDNIRKWL